MKYLMILLYLLFFTPLIWSFFHNFHFSYVNYFCTMSHIYFDEMSVNFTDNHFLGIFFWLFSLSIILAKWAIDLLMRQLMMYLLQQSFLQHIFFVNMNKWFIQILIRHIFYTCFVVIDHSVFLLDPLSFNVGK